MKRLNYFSGGLLILVLMFLLGACNKNNDEIFEIDGDVVFIKKTINDEVVWGAAYYAYGNKSISSATATLPNSVGTVDLEAYGSYTYTFTKEPGDQDFGLNFPMPGSYSFEATNTSGLTAEATDDQDYYNIGIAEIDSIIFEPENLWLHVKWNDVDGADAYVVRLFKTNGVMIFNGVILGTDEPEYFISTYHNTGTWSEAPVKNSTYELRVQSIIYDSDATASDFNQNVQEISVASQPIVWELN